MEENKPYPPYIQEDEITLKNLHLKIQEPKFHKLRFMFYEL